MYVTQYLYLKHIFKTKLRTYAVDNYTDESESNETYTEDVEPHFDVVMIKHEEQLGSSPQPQYTITNVYNQFITNDFFLHQHIKRSISLMMALAEYAYSIYTSNQMVCKGEHKKQIEFRIRQYLLMVKSIPQDSADVFKYCASGMYYL
ncbi:MAG: hypothetical protein EZS28_001596 [Streblomastix strix]|uniref:Uncharacterized protein n=1 Tax=Streblomastix strix TaxID=222440 RepID=A0A5J4X6K1_9EUKA|nr:MAG: hypothetical protein EZS28_001596 [Streblomastix strix]